MTGEKLFKCYKCKEHLPAVAFAKDKSRSRGLTGYCKQCLYAKHNARYDATYRAENKDVLATYLAEWRAANPHKTAEYTATRRARLAAAFVEVIDRRVIWGRDEGHCRVQLVCSGTFVPFEEMHLDHIIPLAKGGKHAYGNVQTSCGPCNLHKGTRVLELRMGGSF